MFRAAVRSLKYPTRSSKVALGALAAEAVDVGNGRASSSPISVGRTVSIAAGRLKADNLLKFSSESRQKYDYHPVRVPCGRETVLSMVHPLRKSCLGLKEYLRRDWDILVPTRLIKIRFLDGRDKQSLELVKQLHSLWRC